ncbi:hypothetical protein GCM10009120_32330 [Sphingobacterium siyangense subsp. cladoniae]|uniref:hypothetical protein n=1 Tax=Sphingobacterium siyangense TaxID=459529 RepID=UPI0031F91900
MIKYIFITLLLVGCTEGNNKLYIPQDLKDISIDAHNRTSKPYKFIFYSGDNSCNKCFLNIIIWKSIIEESKYELGDKIDFIFIFSNKKKDNTQQLVQEYSLSENKSYIDSSGSFGILNKFDSSTTDFKGFLVDNNYNIIIIGDPSRDKSIWEKIKKTI